MFSMMRDRVATTTGMRSISLEDLAKFETESIDSLPRSDVVSITSSNISKTYSIGSGVSFFDKIGLRRGYSSSFSEISSEKFLTRPKDTVIKILRSIKEMNNVPSSKMSLIPFFEMIQSHYYKNVSLSLYPNIICYQGPFISIIIFTFYIMLSIIILLVVQLM